MRELTEALYALMLDQRSSAPFIKQGSVDANQDEIEYSVRVPEPQTAALVNWMAAARTAPLTIAKLWTRVRLPRSEQRRAA
jgi:hypothetical protein